MWDASGAWHTRARAPDRVAFGGTRPEDGRLPRHNLHSVRGANFVGPGWYALVQPGVEADTWQVGGVASRRALAAVGGVPGSGGLPARRSLTPNALGAKGAGGKTKRKLSRPGGPATPGMASRHAWEHHPTQDGAPLSWMCGRKKGGVQSQHTLCYCLEVSSGGVHTNRQDRRHPVK